LNPTTIEWVRNTDGSQGYTWNPITGCLNHKDGLCKGGGFPCYAYKLAHGRLEKRYLANDNLVSGYLLARGVLRENTISPRLDPFYPRWWPERLKKPYNSIKPVGIFVCDMGELFGDWIPEDWQKQIFEVIRHRPQHRFYMLTKQPQNLPKWSPFPENCCVGATITNQIMAQHALKYLASIKATIKFLSCEPLLSRINLPDAAGCGYYCDPSRGIEGHHDHAFFTPGINSVIDWLIIGAQTKPYKPPKIEWVEEIVKACDTAGVPVFLKDNLKPLVPQQIPFYNQIDKDPFLTPRLRQEMPDG
jgi:protein gp37